MNFLIRLLLSAISVLVAAYLLPGAAVDGFFSAFIVAIFLALFSATLKPILTFLTIPITILTLGLFLLVINALMVLLADYIVSGFAVSGFWSALFFGIIVAIVNSIFESLSRERR